MINTGIIEVHAQNLYTDNSNKVKVFKLFKVMDSF